MVPLPWFCAVVAYSFLSMPMPPHLNGKQSSSSDHGRRTTGPLFFWKTLLSQEVDSKPVTASNYENSEDPDFPWKFEGRAVLCPMIVRLSQEQDEQKLPYQPWSIGGWTLGGVVALEYDDSPVGQYIEYVELGCLASVLHTLEGGEESKSNSASRFLVGQVGSKLFVNERRAMALCEQVWNLNALSATATVIEQHGDVMAAFFPSKADPDVVFKLLPSIPVSNLPLWWTPTITAIWAKLVPSLPQTSSASTSPLPLNRLRISGKAKWMPRRLASRDYCISLGFGIAVNDVLIEISDQVRPKNDS